METIILEECRGDKDLQEVKAGRMAMRSAFKGCLCEDLLMIVTANTNVALTMLLSILCTFNSVQFSHSVLSDSLRPHGLQHAMLPCPSPTPGFTTHESNHGRKQKRSLNIPVNSWELSDTYSGLQMSAILMNAPKIKFQEISRVRHD